MLEKLDKYPYYLDYFAIFEEYQNKGYGTKAIMKLQENIGKDGLIGEIEKEDDHDPITIKRFKFYADLGFKKADSEYLLYEVYYTPIVYMNYNKVSKEEIDKIFFAYYNANCGEDEVKKHCKLIR